MTSYRPNESIINRSANWVSDHWLATFNTLVGLYVLFPLLAPLLLAIGLNRPATILYRIYSPTCHQMAFRSLFFGGDQTVYPREHAHTLHPLVPFESYAEHLEEFDGVSLDGLDNDLILAARRFTGNEQMGYKSAICQRDLTIFGFLFIGGLVFAILRQRGITVRRLPIVLFILIGMGPIALDGFSQLFSYYIPSLAVRESPPYLRLGTGALFGFCVAWVVLPYIESGSSKSDKNAPHHPVNDQI